VIGVGEGRAARGQPPSRNPSELFLGNRALRWNTVACIAAVLLDHRRPVLAAQDTGQAGMPCETPLAG